MRLDSKVILVAGGAGYLGTPVCRALAQHGAAVAIADIHDAQARQLAADIVSALPQSRTLGLAMDIGKEAEIRAAVQHTIQAFGRLDAVVNMTYGSIGKRVEELTADEFDRANQLNLTGSFLLAREAASQMQAGGSIVIFSSMYGHISPDPRIYEPPMNPNPIEYGVGKAGIEQMVRYLAVHYGPRGIRVNGIAPGPFPNPKGQEDREFMARLSYKVPLGRIGRQEEIVGPVLFLASDAASYVTGHILNVDGGWTAW